MPTISIFYGIVIQMFWDEHAPPHFHTSYAEYKATVNIRELCISEGSLPRRATHRVPRIRRYVPRTPHTT